MCESRRCPGPLAPKVLAEIWRIVLDVFGYPSWLLYSSELPCSAHIFKSPVRGCFLSSPQTPHPLPLFLFLLISSGEWYSWDRGRKSKMLGALCPISSPMVKDRKTFFPPGGGGRWRLGSRAPLRSFLIWYSCILAFANTCLDLESWRARAGRRQVMGCR